MTLFVAAVATTLLCMDRSGVATPVRGGGQAVAQPWVQRLTGSLRRSVRAAGLVVQRQALAMSTEVSDALPPAVRSTVARRIWSPFRYSLPPPVA